MIVESRVGIIVLIGLARDRYPLTGSALGNPKLELIIDVACAGLAAMALGLLVSAMMRSSDKAISVLVLLVVGQLIMSMPVHDIAHWGYPSNRSRRNGW